MNDVIQYKFLTPFTYMSMFIGNNFPLTNWLVFGKIAENPVVTPSTSVQVVRPSGVNRYLASVTVEATTTTTPTTGA